MKRNSPILIFLLLLSSTGLLQRARAQEIKGKDVQKILEDGHVIQEHFTGFLLYDPEQKKTIYSLNADKYFVPASNTKLFTVYTAMNMLGDSLPGMRYIVRGDSLIFWGTGDPSFLHPDLHATRVFDFLKGSPLKLVYSAGNYRPPFRPFEHDQVSPFPVNTNTALVYAENGQLKVRPDCLQGWLTPDRVSASPRWFHIRVSEDNQLFYPANMPVPANFKEEVSLTPNAELTVRLLQDALGRPVGLSQLPLPDSAATLYSIPSDSLYRRCWQPSDNYLAEQIVLLCASTFKGMMRVDSVHRYAQEHFFKDLPAKAIWVSGAGFPGNLFTPETIIALLIKIRAKVGNDALLFSMLPNGGVNGTIGEAYKTDNGKPFVFAKTGTLQFAHNQSGFIVTRKGRLLLFSFMNLDFVRTTAEIRNEMVRVMTAIHNQY